MQELFVKRGDRRGINGEKRRMRKGRIRWWDINLIRRARWGVNPRPVREERGRVGVISHIVAFRELRDVSVNKIHV